MASDYFMKIDGIPGDTTDKSHPNEIQVASWSWGETNSTTVVPAFTGRPDIQNFHFTTGMSKASPLLFISCATGTHAATAVLTGRKVGTSTPIEYLKITLTDVLISAYQTGASASDDVPLDQVSLNFGKIQISYTPVNPDGTTGTAITRGWDLAAGKSF
jgi:type VI secretion system secreted protein Hcp